MDVEGSMLATQLTRNTEQVLEASYIQPELTDDSDFTSIDAFEIVRQAHNLGMQEHSSNQLV